MKIFFSLLFALSSLFSFSDHPYPGGIKLITLNGFYKKPKVFYKSHRVKVLKIDNKYIAVIGIDLSEKIKTQHILAIQGETKKDFYFSIYNKKYKTEYIKLKSNKRVKLSKRDLKIYYANRKKSKKILSSFTKNLCNLQFVAPLKGVITSEFGKRRYFNNIPKAPHKGIDISAKKGTPILASESGIVKICEKFFFNGNTIYIDHGEGVISIYCHLNKFNVKKGDFVKKGDIIGFVGATGRATGPHLHFGIILNQTSINPSIFIKDYQN